MIYAIIGLIYVVIGIANVMMTSFIKGGGGLQATSALEDIVRFVGGPLYILFTLSQYAHMKGKALRLIVNK